MLFPAAALLLVAVLAGPVAGVLLTLAPADVLRELSTTPIADALRTSIEASLLATAAATLLGVPAGYALMRASEAMRSVALVMLALPLAFPPVASGIILLYGVGPASPLGAAFARAGLSATDSLLGVALAEFFVSGSFAAIAAAAAFSATDGTVADAVRTLGVGEWRIFWRIALPAASPGIVAGIALGWLRAIGEYGATSIVAYHPTSLPVALYVTLASEGVRPALAIAYAFVVCAALVVAAAWILRRRVVL